MAIPRLLKILTITGGGLLLAGAVIAITAFATGVPGFLVAAAAPTPTPSGSPKAVAQQYCQTFLNNFASDLGKKPSDVQAAAVKAFGQTVDQAVKDGKLTAAQGAQLKQKAANGTLCDGFGIGAIGGHGPGDHGMGGLGGMYLNDAAKALGMSEQDLMTQLKSGQTLQQIAAAKGMDEQQFRDKFTAAVKADLDAQVQSGKLTQAQEDSILNRLKTAPLPFWNQTPPARRPKASPSPGTSG